MIASLNQRFHIIGIRKCVQSITHSCVICRQEFAKTQHQMMGKLPNERITPDPGRVFLTH
jgi:hypothetical protein